MKQETRIISLAPRETSSFASFIISSIGLERNLPLIYGITQYVHLLSQPSEIFKYTEYSGGVTALSPPNSCASGADIALNF